MKIDTIKSAFTISIWGAIILMTLLFSGVIYASSIETLYSMDLPYVNSLNSQNTTSLLPANFENQPEFTSLNGNPLGDYGKPVSLYLPSVSRRLEIVPLITKDNSILLRPNNVHYTIESKDNIANTYLFMNSSWRAVNNPEEIKNGSYIYIDTQREWRYIFEIVDSIKLPTEFDYTLPKTDNSQLLLIIKKDTELYIFRSVYRNIISK